MNTLDAEMAGLSRAQRDRRSANEFVGLPRAHHDKCA